MASYALLCLASIITSFAFAANPSIKVGLTLAKCGLGAQSGEPVGEALWWWANYTNSHGGVNVNGTVHDIELIMYELFVESSAFSFDALLQIQRRF